MLDKIEQDLGQAMRAREQEKVSVLRMLKSSLLNAKINKKSELTDEEIIKVVRKELKQRKESADAFTAADRKEMAEQELSEAEILQNYLPAEMPDSELVEIVTSAIKELDAKSMADMGKVMGAVKSKTGGSVDGSRISELVKKALS